MRSMCMFSGGWVFFSTFQQSRTCHSVSVRLYANNHNVCVQNVSHN